MRSQGLLFLLTRRTPRAHRTAPPRSPPLLSPSAPPCPLESAVHVSRVSNPS